MTINNPEKFCASLWDWACLDGCFGVTRIKPSDIDGIIERNGKFLVIETKLPGVEIPTGQDILLKALAAKEDFMVLCVWGYPGQPEKLVFWINGSPLIIDPSTLANLRFIVSAWFQYADLAK